MVITDTGLKLLRSLLDGNNQTINFMAVGLDASTVSSSDTTLNSETGNRVTTGSFRKYNTGITNDVGMFTKRGEFSTTNNVTGFTEIGVFDATSGGNLFNHITLTNSITQSSTQRVRIDIDYQVRRG